MDISDEGCETLLRLRDTQATADVLAELFTRLETRAHVAEPASEELELRVIRSAEITIDGETVPPIRIVYTIEPNGLPADSVLAIDIAYVGSDDDVMPSIDGPQHLPLNHH